MSHQDLEPESGPARERFAAKPRRTFTARSIVEWLTTSGYQAGQVQILEPTADSRGALYIVVPWTVFDEAGLLLLTSKLADAEPPEGVWVQVRLTRSKSRTTGAGKTPETVSGAWWGPGGESLPTHVAAIQPARAAAVAPSQSPSPDPVLTREAVEKLALQWIQTAVNEREKRIADMEGELKRKDEFWARMLQERDKQIAGLNSQIQGLTSSLVAISTHREGIDVAQLAERAAAWAKANAGAVTAGFGVLTQGTKAEKLTPFVSQIIEGESP